MRRELEFRNYLKRNRISPKNVGYCKNHIEKAFGGKDMDEIIGSHQNISKVRAKLQAVETKENSINDYMGALNRYLEFSVSASTGSATYKNSIASFTSNAELHEFLEDELEQIREFAKKVLGRTLQDYPEIPIYLSDAKPTRTYYMDYDKLLIEIRRRCADCRREECRPPECNMGRILKQYQPITNKICGEFHRDPQPYIVIYYNNFDNPSVHDPEFLSAVAQTLAHEYLHFLHYIFAGEDEFSNARKELKEALADFFGVIYSVHRGQKYDLVVAEKRYNEWEDYKHSVWPYAKALFFYRVNKNRLKHTSHMKHDQYVKAGCIGKFVQIFADTKNPKRAYDSLISY